VQPSELTEVCEFVTGESCPVVMTSCSTELVEEDDSDHVVYDVSVPWLFTVFVVVTVSGG
jgi:hypothetical protein